MLFSPDLALFLWNSYTLLNMRIYSGYFIHLKLHFLSKMWKLQIIDWSRCKSYFFWYCNTIFINFRPQFRHRQNAVGLGLGDHVSTPLSLLTATINVSFPDRATKPSAEIQTFLIAILAFYFAFGVTLWYNYFKYLFLVFSCFSLVWMTKEGKLRNMIFTHHNK